MAEFVSHYDHIIKSIETQLMDTTFRITREGDLADAAFQDTLIKIWEKWHKVIRHPNPKALCLRICINTCYDRLRKAHRKRELIPLDEIPESLAADPAQGGDRYVSEETVSRTNIPAGYKQISEDEANALGDLDERSEWSREPGGTQGSTAAIS